MKQYFLTATIYRSRMRHHSWQR